MTDTCEAIWEFLGIEAACGQSPAVPYRRICVHEHIRDGLLCAEHAARQNGMCLTCIQGPQPHKCPITIVPLEVTR